MSIVRWGEFGDIVVRQMAQVKPAVLHELLMKNSSHLETAHLV